MKPKIFRGYYCRYCRQHGAADEARPLPTAFWEGIALPLAPLYNVICICKGTLAVAVVEDLDGPLFQQLIAKPKYAMSGRPAGRT